MEYTPEQKRLRQSAEQIMTLADHKTATKINNEVLAEVAKGHLFYNSGHALELARVIGDGLDEALPKLFAAYNSERGKLVRDSHSLDGIVRSAIDNFIEGSERHAPVPKMDWGLMAQTFEEALEERRKLARAAAEEHFRHPGLPYWPQRHPVAFWAMTALVVFVLGIVSRVVWK